MKLRLHRLQVQLLLAVRLLFWIFSTIYYLQGELVRGAAGEL